ncbi:MAG TPA: 3-carboxy-cis,cis-muconate cycloisomerase [Candidatus Acidoferrales bacterium]|nr:3-carboxy-cis,cis-muconate cycloisomerase [Candidatus Acidoferrales bacterium]
MDQLFGSADVDDAAGDVAWLQAMLDAEAALAGAEAAAGLVPAEAAAEITSACRAERFDIADIGRRAVAAGNPAAPLVSDLVAAVSPATQRYVHLGATSQDIIDTALSLIAQRALDLILADLRDAATACAALAATHREALMTARTLLQPAVPTTFGLKAAGWLVAIDEARELLTHVRSERLAVQLGGAAGTLAPLRESGARVVHGFAERLGLAEPVMPWHTDRTRSAELAAALGTAIGVLGKIARDVTLLAQAEVAEAREGGDAEHGTSSTLPQKHNPVRAVLVIAAAERAPGLVATVFHAMVQEHERATGAWHAEWETVRALLRLAGGAGRHAARLLSTLSIDPARMAENLGSDGGLVMAESLAGVLAVRSGRGAARDIVRRCSDEAAQRHVAFATVVATDPAVCGHLTAAEIAAALDPGAYLGSAQEFIRRAERAHAAIEVSG